MPLADVQRALAHLYTDAASRAQLRVDPAAFRDSFGLDDAGLVQVASMGTAGLRAYTDSLDRKRASAAARELPISARFLGTRFREAFLRFARTTPLGEGPQRYRNDTHAFVAYVRGAKNGAVDGRARALLAYEISRSPGVRRYPCDVRALARAIAEGAPATDFESRPTLILTLPNRREFAIGLPNIVARGATPLRR